MKKMSVIITLSMTILLIMLLSGCFRIALNTKAVKSGNNVVKIEASNADDLGSLQFEVIYDSSVLQAVSVQSGKLAGKAILESNMDQPGRVWIGLIHPQGISGDGTLAAVSFNVVGQTNSPCKLNIVRVKARNAETLSDIATQVSHGEFSGATNQFTHPVITFLP